ncbi:MAG: DNA topoisomerase (ATP-hydrolyzing) subunit A, partial [Candidatus Thorarchaeota archaeon]
MTSEQIEEILLKDEMQSSYIDYAMSVVVGRAIPDVRDGLKHVHRRIIYAMAVNNWYYTSSHVKCAKIVGETLGNYHPHGDMAVYNALVRMGQDFSLRYPLIHPQGNFGSIDGDPPAAYRYTEARLSQISNELIEDIDKDTVDFQPNFDNSTSEPLYLPAKLPNILLNGTKGIAVGMATSMAPHNLTEVCNAIIATIDEPDISIEELMEIIKGPDFPTGGIITDINGIYNAYHTGNGAINISGRIETETTVKKTSLIITEIPYLVNKTDLIESIAKLIKDGVLKDVRDLRDESDRKGMRIVLDLSRNAQPVIVKNILFKRTRLLTTFNITNLVLINEGKQPKILNLKEIINEYIEHRLIIISKRTEYLLKKAQERLHRVEGLLLALNDIDNVVNLIKSSKDTNEAKSKLKATYELSDIQVQAILSMPLSRLTNLEQQKLVDEQASLQSAIIKYNKILKQKKLRLNIIKKDLTELIKKYGDDRKTEIKMVEHHEVKEIEKKDLIKKETTIVIFTKNQYIKR